MSNSIFPIPPGNVSGSARGWPIKKWPLFPDALVQTPTNNVGETRIARAIYGTWQFEMTFPKLTTTFNDQTGYLAKVAGFFMSMQGRANSWLFDDLTDNAIPGSAPAPFGVGDGVTKSFQIVRPIGDYQDIIQNLNAVPTPSIYDAGILLSSGYSIDAKGVVAFTVAPTAGHVLSWSGKYYFRCRFMKDAVDSMENVFTNFWKIGQLQWISILQ